MHSVRGCALPRSSGALPRRASVRCDRCIAVIFYGLPLGLLYASAERRVIPVQRPYSYQ
jgi:hypothetical protein